MHTEELYARLLYEQYDAYINGVDSDPTTDDRLGKLEEILDQGSIDRGSRQCMQWLRGEKVSTTRSSR